MLGLAKTGEEQLLRSAFVISWHGFFPLGKVPRLLRGLSEAVSVGFYDMAIRFTLYISFFLV